MKKHNLSSINLTKENSKLTNKIKTLENKLAMSNLAFLNIVGRSLDGILIINQKKMVLYTNYAAIKLFDRNIANLIGEPLDICLDLENASHERSAELKIDRPNGTYAITEVSIVKTEWNNEPCYVVSFRDITERKKTEEILEYMSHHDSLTSLPNRTKFERQMQESLQKAIQNEGYMAILYLDLDNFKMVNDTLGHDKGDKLLKKVSRALKDNIRGNDTVARIGGDEFAIIINELKKPNDAAVVAKNIINIVSNCYKIDGHDIYTNTSIGIAVYPDSGRTSIELVKNADTAMYSAKRNGKNQFCYYSPKLNNKNARTMQLLNGLRSVIKNKELFLEYQPIVDIHNNKFIGFEALIRWQHPELGLIPPIEFLPYAEESQAMIEIGHWVIANAIKDFKKITPNYGDSFISINISTKELDDPKTVQVINREIKKSGVAARNIAFELTETSIMRNPEDSITKFNVLNKAGISIAVDDYGTGHSSLSYLKSLPIAILKIDKSFIDDIGKELNNTIIVKSTIQLAHNLGLKVVAEGVETKEQLDFLKNNNCDYVQGFYFAKPLPLTKIKKLMQDFSKKN